MSRDLIAAAMECNFYNEIFVIDDEVIKDIADNYNVDFKELKNKWEEIYYE